MLKPTINFSELLTKEKPLMVLSLMITFLSNQRGNTQLETNMLSALKSQVEKYRLNGRMDTIADLEILDTDYLITVDYFKPKTIPETVSNFYQSCIMPIRRYCTA